jgi:hypothetical protein
MIRRVPNGDFMPIVISITPLIHRAYLGRHHPAQECTCTRTLSRHDDLATDQLSLGAHGLGVYRIATWAIATWVIATWVIATQVLDMFCIKNMRRPYWGLN